MPRPGSWDALLLVASACHTSMHDAAAEQAQGGWMRAEQRLGGEAQESCDGA